METRYDKFELFKNSLSSLKETSKDSDSKEISYMTESDLQVVNFDKVKEKYAKKLGVSETPCSNDALYLSEAGNYYFIEFKNGKIQSNVIYNVYNKIYDSLLIFTDIVDERVSFCRNNVNFILVYNEEKNPNNTDVKEDKSRVAIGKHFMKKGGKRFVRFNLEKFEKLYFHAVYTYTESEFEQEFVQKYSIND